MVEKTTFNVIRQLDDRVILTKKEADAAKGESVIKTIQATSWIAARMTLFKNGFETYSHRPGYGYYYED